MAESVFKVFSIGKVSDNKARGSDTIHAIPTEYRFSADEEVLRDVQKEEVSYKTPEGSSATKAIVTNSIECTWLKRNTNRVTPPDVRRDDQVVIWRLGDSDRYFWEDMGTANVKRLETVIFAFSADPSAAIKGDLSNAYVFQVSSHEKQITLTTSKSNGEPYAWTAQFNTGDGLFSVESDGGEEFAVDSKNQRIWAKNSKGTIFDLNKKNITVHADDNATFDIGKAVTFNCKTFTVNASSGVIFNTPEVKCSQELKVGGNAAIGGSLTFGGTGRGEGGFSASTIKADNSVTAPYLHGRTDD